MFIDLPSPINFVSLVIMLKAHKYQAYKIIKYVII